MVLYGKWLALKTLATQARSFANWPEVFAAYRAGHTLPTLRLRSGVSLEHGFQDDAWSLFREIFLEHSYLHPGFYQPKPGDCVVDMGANIGFFAVQAATQARGIQVHCFEPSARNRQFLERNIRANGLQSSVKVYPVGVLNRHETLTLHHACQMGGSSLFSEQASDPSGIDEFVRCIPATEALEEVLKESPSGRIQFLKIDIEGAEIEVLEEIPPWLWSKIDRVVLEYHNAIRPGCLDRCLDVLRQHFRNWSHVSQGPANELGIIRASEPRN